MQVVRRWCYRFGSYVPLEKLLAAPVTVAFDDAGAEHFRGDPRLLKLDLGLSLAVVWPPGGDRSCDSW